MLLYQILAYTIRQRITFKAKTGYCIKLLMPETLKLLAKTTN